MSASPLVSIILATYNGENYLAAQLDSIFAQSYPNIEVIAVDDGSSDGTVDILRSYAGLHPGMMKVFVNDSNLGFIRNFDKGCSLCSGVLIALCDQDDYWYPEKIAAKVAAIGDHALIYCDSRLCDEHLQPLGRNISDLIPFQSFYDPLQLSVFCRMYGHAILFTRKLFVTAHPFFDVIPPDWWLPYLATYQGGVKYLPEILVDYRQHAANVSGVIGRKRSKKRRQSRRERTSVEVAQARRRMERFYEVCPADRVREKKVLGALLQSYQSFSLLNDFRRIGIFFANYKVLLTVKKYSTFRKLLFCCKMFVKIK